MPVLLARVESAIFSPYPAKAWAVRGMLLAGTALYTFLLLGISAFVEAVR